ncbi:MAG TPA: hypothetical protein VK619_13465 [Pyrinomonadaceae bacterium]|nr:hypothetical protein [Pyrinomonadaceae bacterium]
MADNEALKLLVIQKAREQAKAGAHYLWGAAGNTPGNSDGAWYRPSHAQLHPNVPDLEPLTQNRNAAASKHNVHVPTLFAAFVDSSDQGLLPCVGRTVQFPMPLALDAMDKDKHAAFDLKLKNLTDAQIEEFQRNAGNAASFRWPRPNSALGNNNPHHSTVWGESCVGKRHFDCIGFINWLLSETLNKHIQYGIANYTNKNVGTEVEVAQAQTCDIVTKGVEHIGLVSDTKTVIEAMDVLNGVVEGAFKPTRWTQCFRLPASMWE